ncbi:hypothetical protein AC579_4752 [Pseudocercospora musae]|uniref:Uncharacterized protein n=1 Tax=Pseudocercospora musae TaxID=113226 RepID=A0A139IQA0_9PEZI|nr:hypothetical protein AC579_4752 [Pseudocercospora musae]KXT16910.1 hypothetical protein AC579_4752 [Pseudocercospora musae]KXT16911.1 hypothetical protein AC579_4752 [Pseudocercospora musae]KXT16914.1 hypothetical protein AC579_4752 [Pseudocercospora musae]
MDLPSGALVMPDSSSRRSVYSLKGMTAATGVAGCRKYVQQTGSSESECTQDSTHFTEYTHFNQLMVAPRVGQVMHREATFSLLHDYDDINDGYSS